ncbi:ABC transporter substrate-binding protein [Sphingosinicella sp. CPCC 101087]|uniref:ABC transporter substrate-binding protein n=1 Tax=Sphingosinicella sp. CPCC 101087 TaxID=2497754 RepID=UPI00101BE996|nr:ABC transporter substrate-binding protein [Sphingosinicella sp. CPCC 101087]
MKLPEFRIVRRFAGGWRVALAAMAVAGCAHASQPEPKPDTLNVFGMHQTIELAPVHFAAARIYPGGAAVHNGGIPNLFAPPGEIRADVATHAETQALRNSLEHPNVRIILTIARGHYRIVARRSAGISSLADLRGKRIATMLDTSAGFYLHNVLASAGLTQADVQIMSLPRPRDISRHIIEREVDALAIWEPEMQRAIDALGDDAIIFAPDVDYDELFNLNTTAENLADPTLRVKIVRFVAGLMQASQQVMAAPDEAIGMVVATTGYPVELVRSAWPHHTFPGTVADDLLDVLVREETWLAARQGRPARDREQLSRLIDKSVAEEARALLASQQANH